MKILPINLAMQYERDLLFCVIEEKKQEEEEERKMVLVSQGEQKR